MCIAMIVIVVHHSHAVKLEFAFPPFSLRLKKQYKTKHAALIMIHYFSYILPNIDI